MVKIPIEPKITDPIKGLLPQSNWLNFGTANPAITTTIKKDSKTAAPPNLGVAC